MLSTNRIGWINYVVVILLIIASMVLYGVNTYIFQTIMIVMSILTIGVLIVDGKLKVSLLQRKNLGFLIWFAVFFVFIAIHYNFVSWDSFSFLRRMRIWLPALLLVIWLSRIKDEVFLVFFGKCCVLASVPITIILFTSNDLKNVIGQGERFGVAEGVISGNMIALYMLFLILFSLVLFMKCPKWKVPSLIFSVLLTSIIIITGCRRALISVFFLFLIFAWLSASKKNRMKILLLTLLLLVVVVYLLINVDFLYQIVGFRMEKLLMKFGLIATRTTDDFYDYSAEIRQEFVPLAWAMFLRKPFLGNGYAYFITHNGLNNALQGYSTHNNYLEILVNYGVVGFLVYYSLIIIIIIKLFRYRKQDNIMLFLLLFFLIHLVLIEPTTVNFTSYSIFYVLYYIFYRNSITVEKLNH